MTREDLTAYVAALQAAGLAPATVERRVASVKSFHKSLVRDGITTNHPSAALPLPAKPERLPDVVSIDDVERLLSQPFPQGPVGYRDRAVLEMLYGCGLRVSELCGLDLRDVDLTDGFIRVFGKGSKERIVPIAGAAVTALQDYLAHGRPYLRTKSGTRRQDPDAVFINVRGGRLTRVTIFEMVRSYGAQRRPEAPSAHAAALVRHAHARGRRRPARAAGDARARGHLDDPGLHARRP